MNAFKQRDLVSQLNSVQRELEDVRRELPIEFQSLVFILDRMININKEIVIELEY